jgi:hypothetical protein
MIEFELRRRFLRGVVAAPIIASTTSLASGSAKATTPIRDAYTVTSADTTLFLDGLAYYTVTFPDPSEFPFPFVITLFNADSRAKWINMKGAPGAVSDPASYLWPRQSAIVFNNGQGGWALLGRDRWRIGFANQGTQAAKLHIDPTYGNDAFGSTDGLAAGTGALKSFQGAYVRALAEIDLNAGELTLQLASSATESENLHFAAWGLPGVSGGAGLVVDGGGGTLAGQIQLYFGYQGLFQNMEITGGFSLARGASCQLNPNISFGPCSNPHILADGRSQFLVVAPYSISGGAPCHVALDNGSILDTLIRDITGTVIGSGIKFTEAFVIAGSGSIYRGFASWNNSAGVIDTLSYIATLNAIVSGVSALPGNGGTLQAGAHAM